MNLVPTAEVISIGDELTSGQRLDTNSQWLSRRLSEIGLRPLFHTTVADDEGLMRQAFEQASQRADVTLITGGLGPTGDDLTRQVIAEVAGVPLLTDQAAVQYIEELFVSRGRSMPESNRVQAMYPAGGCLIPNLTGTAPGVDYQIQNTSHTCRFFAFPGVPAELKPMWRDYARPAIIEQFPELGIIVHHAIHCFGLGESDVERRLPDLIRRGRIPTVGITATKATITLRISAAGANPNECQAIIGPTAKLIRDEFAEYIFGENEITLPEVLIALLTEKQATLSVVDLGGCSLIAEWLNDADTTGQVYRGTVSLSQPDPSHSIEKLVNTAQTTFATDYVLVIGPILEDSEIPQRDVAIYGDGKQLGERFHAASNPSIVVQRSIKQALNFMRLAVERGDI